MASYIVKLQNLSGYKEMTNTEKLQLIRKEARRLSKSRAMSELFSNIKEEYPNTKFGKIFWVDLAHFIVFKSYISSNSFSEDVRKLAINYKNINKEDKFRYIQKHAKLIKKDKRYSDSSVERNILMSRREKKRPFGEYFWSDIAHYIYQ